jgi:hypothetical protein
LRLAQDALKRICNTCCVARAVSDRHRDFRPQSDTEDDCILITHNTTPA